MKIQLYYNLVGIITHFIHTLSIEEYFVGREDIEIKPFLVGLSLELADFECDLFKENKYNIVTKGGSVLFTPDEYYIAEGKIVLKAVQ